MRAKFLGHWLTAEVAVSCGLLVLWLTQSQGLGDGTRTAVKLNPDIDWTSARKNKEKDEQMSQMLT